MNRTRQITEAGLFAALIFIFIVGGFFIPVLGNFLVLLTPVPVAILTIRNKNIYVVASVVTAGLISSTLVTLVYGMSMAFLALLVGLPIGIGIKTQKSTLLTIGVAGIGALIGYMGIYKVAEIVTGISILETFTQAFDISAQMQTDISQLTAQLGLETDAGRLEQAQELLKQMELLLQMAFPALMLTVSMMYSGLNYLVTYKMLPRLRIQHRKLESFAQFSYPKHLAYGSTSMIVLAALIGYMGWMDSEVLMINFLYLFIFLFVIQGYAVGYSLLSKSMGKGVSIFLLVLLTILGSSPYIAIAGYFDVLFDFRKRMR